MSVETNVVLVVYCRTVSRPNTKNQVNAGTVSEQSRRLATLY